MEETFTFWIAIYLGLFPLTFILTLLFRRLQESDIARLQQVQRGDRPTLAEAQASEERAGFWIYQLGSLLVLIGPALLGWKVASALQNRVALAQLKGCE